MAKKDTKEAPKPIEINAVQGQEAYTATVVRTLYGKEVGRAEDEGVLAVHRFVTEPAKIGLSMGVTLNLGNYEGIRVDVSLTMPCYVEEADKVEQYVTNWVETRVVKEIESARDHTRKRSD